MEIPESAIKVKLKAGKKYALCSCGNSKTMPYCDNTHRDVNEKKGTSYKSFKIYPETDISVHVYSANWDNPA